MTEQSRPVLNGVGWDADPAVPEWAGFPPLHGSTRADACVVGLGGSGLAAIEELTTRGLSVVGVDAGRVAAGAAGRNGGFLSGGGAMSLSGTDGTVDEDLRFDLYRQTMAELDRLTDQLGEDVIRRVGSIRLAGLPGDPEDVVEEADRARELLYCTEEVRALRSLGVAVEEYNGELGRGFFNPDTAVMNPVRRAFGLASRLSSSARLFEHTSVSSIQPGAVETELGHVDARIVIVAVDGKLDVLVPQLSPLTRTVRLQMLATEPLGARRLPCAVGCRWGYEWAQQDSAGRLLLGGGRDHFIEEENTTEDLPTEQVQSWIEGIAARVAGQPVTVTHRWAASAGYTKDQRGLCIPVDEGVVACGGYSGSGNLVGPIAARAAVTMALDGTVPPAYLRSSF